MESLLAKPSKVSRFRRGSRSVKTTIPIEVAELLKLKPGDTIIWEVKLTNGERVALVKRMAP
jgi:bifunctional DNA-binding transcriptional regulator/antitoxin component of YhaV-PrlF toxin-antitoxin module